MQKSDLLRHNVSHLVVFQSLMQTGNVTASAGELHMSQPAVSRALAHLREMFDDPLFIRAPGGVIPTEHAQQLAPRVTELVDQLANLFEPQIFDLAATDRTFRIATTDYGASTVILETCRAFNEQAPNATLEITPFSDDIFRDLAVGKLDLVLYAGASMPQNLHSEYLFDETYSCICRKHHPAAQPNNDGRIPLDDFLAWPHALVTVFGGRHGVIDTALKERGLERHIALRLPYFSTAPLITARSDMLLTLPTRTARYFEQFADLECLRVPIEIPSFAYHQLWHERSEHDPALSWLRNLIKDISSGPVEAQ